MIDFVNLVNATAASVLAALVNSAVISIVMAGLAWAFLHFAKSVNASTRHVILWALLLALVALPAARLVPWEAILEPEAAPVLSSETTPDDAPVAAPASVGAPPLPEQQSSTLRVDPGYLPLLLTILWASICLAQVARVCWSYAYLRRLKQTATPAPRQLRLEFSEWVLSCGVGRDVRLLLSDSVASPIAVGFRQPAVIIPTHLPEQIPASDLEHVLLHELAHLARRDDWTNLFARIASGLFVFHPLVLWVLRQIDTEREVACDDGVVAATGSARPYAATLARLVEFRIAQRREMLATGIGGRKSRFSDRIERLVRLKGVLEAHTSIKRVVLCAAALLVLAAAGARAPEWVALAQEAGPEPPQVPAAPSVPVNAGEAAPTVPPTPAPPPVVARAVRPVLAAPAAPPAPVPVPPQPPQPGAAASGESFLKALTDSGYGSLPVDDIIELRNNGVSASWLKAIAQTGWGKLTPQQLIELRRNGVSAEYLASMKDAGFRNLTMTDVIELRRHGVRADSVREIHSLGFGPYNIRQVMEFAQHGLRPEFFRALKDAGFGSADPKEIVSARMNGVTASSLQEAKKYGRNLTLDQIIRLRQAGVI